MARSKESMNILRARVAEQTQNTCSTCGFVGRVHLHHVEYTEESNYRRSGGQYGYTRRMEEYLSHPERFAVLCAACHLSLEAMVERMLKIESDGARDLHNIMLATYKSRKRNGN